MSGIVDERLQSRIARNVALVRARIAAAAARSGRPADAVRLVAVTKYVGVAETTAVARAGCLDLGESRPQDLWAKADPLEHLGVRWHLIGHLQRNKSRRTVPLLSLVHSADSLRILETLAADAASAARRLPVLLEVNVSGDEAKHGFRPAETAAALAAALAQPSLEIRGLMAMAGLDSTPDVARREFAALRELREVLRRDAPSAALDELSMGMSGDYEIAIEEGATLVRVGSALFTEDAP